MKRGVLYAVVPAAALALLLVNAFYGHLVFGPPYEQDIAKYSVYVHLGDEWKSRPGNILFDVTNVWSGPGAQPGPHAVEASQVTNSNRLLFQQQKSLVELRHEFSDCGDSWRPIPYRYAADTLRAGIELAQGSVLGWDPYVLQFPDVPGRADGSDAGQGYAQFIPACTASPVTSYAYAVSVNDPGAWIDVYFVPSQSELDRYAEGESFDFYDRDGCHAQNRLSFSGKCDGVAAGSGLLIVVPDDLDLSLTRVRVSMHETGPSV